MSTRFFWLLVVLFLAVVGLVACGSHFSNSSDGLVIVPSGGSAVVQAFGFNLSNGKPSTINTSPPITGTPNAVVIDPAGAFAYIATSTGITPFAINSNGTLGAGGTTVTVTDLAPSPCTATQLTQVMMTLDTAGKFLYVTTGATGGNVAVGGNCNPVNVGRVATFSVSGGTLTQTAISPPLTALQGPNLVALAVTPLTFPADKPASGANNSICAGLTNTSNEYLYAADAQNNLVWELTVDSSGNLGTPTGNQSIVAGSVPAGIAVDSCNRYVYVSNKQTPTLNSYVICNASPGSPCPAPASQNGNLVPLGSTSLSGAGSQPTAIAVDPLARYVFVVDSTANKLFGFKISQATGTISALSPSSVSTDSVPVSLAIRSDGLWLFVTNFGSGTVSEYAITPASGTLTAGPSITTDNQPFGVAVK